MKRILQSIVLLLMALLVPTAASGAVVQVADGVYSDGSTLYICSNVNSLGELNMNPSAIYCFAALPPACVPGTFTGYDARLHIPASSYGAYFVNEYWGNFANMVNDAVEPTGVTLSSTEANLTAGDILTLNAVVAPNNASLRTVVWSSTDPSVATVNGGQVTALAAGECDIIASCLDKQAVCHVRVVQTTIYITLDKHDEKLLPNHSLTITPTMSPIETTLKVTVSNPRVVAARLVNDAVQVVGLAEGSAMIVVSSADGMAVPDSCMVTVYTELGDVNCSGFVDLGDITDLIDHMLGSDSASFKAANADTNCDGEVNIGDLVALIDYLLIGYWPWDEPQYKIYTVNGVSFKMIAVEGGTFMMGATDEQGSDALDREYPAHEVTLSSYYIGETEVTQALWQAVMGSNPSYYGDLQHPVERVSWDNCQTFINRLNEMTGQHFRLPTEAEWEFAARGGIRSQGFKFSGSNTVDEVAWYWDNIPSQSSGTAGYGTQPVATKAPNELGLYDMSGNVYEWCQDWYGAYSSEAQTNPTGPASGSDCVTRGGGWYSAYGYCRVSYRNNHSPSSTYSTLGLRLANDNIRAKK